MRVVDLDRDMSDVIPTGTSRDSEFLFARMTDETLTAAQLQPGERVLDVASGFGQDAIRLAQEGALVIGAEPSKRMSDWSRLECDKHDLDSADNPGWVRAWADGLPFADASFDAVICKGAIDHFDRPARAISEMARVTRDDGRVVLAIANFESLACRLARESDALRERWLGSEPGRGRRTYDVPSDHFTRYELDLMREQAGRFIELEQVTGISLGWGLAGWAHLTDRMPGPVAERVLQGLDWMARRAPSLADVVVLAGRPRR